MADETLNLQDAGDQAQVKRRKTSAQIIRDQDLADVAWVMSTIQGRRFMWRLWRLARLFHVSADLLNPNQTYFNEGGRNLGLAILADVNEACPQQYLAAMSEARPNPKTKEEPANG